MGRLLTLLAKKQPVATKYDFTGGVAPSGFTYARLVGNATYFGTDGLLHTAAANTLRFGTAGPGSTQILGALLEPLRTNLLWSCRDLTQSSWNNASCTVALDQVGIDGAANSASSITAAAAGAQMWQTVTQSSQKCISGAYFKRITGTGTVKISQDGGVTWTDVTGSLTTSWGRAKIAVATVANPQFIIYLGTSGDKIGVDYAQMESSGSVWDAVLTHPIYTDNTGTAQRRGDNYRNTSIPWFNPSQGTMIVQAVHQGTSTGNTLFYASLDDTTVNNHIQILLSSTINPIGEITIAGTETISGESLASPVALAVNKMALSYQAGNNLFAANGVVDAPGPMGPVGLPSGISELCLGNSPQSTTNAFSGWMQKFTYWNYAMTSTQLQTATT